jgi:nicotinamide phosphoribosyltransferase
MNPILQTDSYKVSHYRQYPQGTQFVHSYLEARGGDYPATVFFGLQYYLKSFLSQQVTRQHVEEANDFFLAHFGVNVFNAEGWMHIINRHDGYLPLHVRAVLEGTIVPVSNVLMTVENTDPRVPWLTNYVETRLMEVWYPITVATLSYYCKQAILRALEQSGDPAGVDFKLHDFGYRGSTSGESAGIGGLAHLVNFKGTDTLAALEFGREYYDEPMAGFSIPAAEHSTITSWGQEHEVDAFRNMLTQYPTGLVAVVSDSYNIYAACEHLWGEVLHDEVLKRPGTLVIRPDSGYPPDVILKCLNILKDKFGGAVNQKGYYVLDSHVRLIQGDGCNPEMIQTILSAMMAKGFSADNIAFGMGGGLLQQVTRDTCQFAFKASNIVINGESRPVHKNPVTMTSKQSKPGRLTLVRTPSGYRTHNMDHVFPIDGVGVMQTVFYNGVCHAPTTLADVRALTLKGV